MMMMMMINNAVVWMVSTCPFIFKSSSPFTNPLRIVPSVPIIIGIKLALMFLCFFCSLDRSRYLSLFLFSINFTQQFFFVFVCFCFFFFCFFTMISSGRLAKIR